MTNEDYKTIKEKCLSDLREALSCSATSCRIEGSVSYEARLRGIDERLWEYCCDVAREDVDLHNIDECLAVRKFLRMMDTYVFDVDKVKKVFRAYEQLKFSGLNGRQCYRLTPVQCFMLAGVFGFCNTLQNRTEEEGPRGTASRNGTEGKNGTEGTADGKNGTDGTAEGTAVGTMRRIVRDATFFIPRKFCKTTMGAFFQFWFFYFEDANSEGYCVANSQDQSKILYKLAYDLIHQLDPDEKRIRFTATEMNWKTGQAREAKVAALSAGGKAKDGMFAQLVTADEYGSAGYVKDHSDMANLLQVMRGSMGPRLEPLVLTTTTAGRVMEGPFELRLRQLQSELMKEIDIPLDGAAHQMDGDWTFLISLHPDVWEVDEESLQDERVWRKCNPHIGVTVQPDYYKNEWKAMLLDEETKREQITKLFNVFQTDRNTAWLTADDIRPLQVEKSIDDINSDDGWVCFVGMDFSKGDDLNAQSYLCYNVNNGEFFADMDAWISERTLVENTNSQLYYLWHKQGWLRTSPGATINEMLVLNRLMEISEHVNIIRIGYDTYDASRFINAIGGWIYSEGEDPKSILRPVSQQFATYNSVVQEMDYMVKNDPPKIHFSKNPMWPWEFGNCMLAVSNDGMENVKPVKSGQNAKVDNVQCILSALHLFDETEGSEN